MSAMEVSQDYRNSLLDLNCNSKPMITMLTMLADENKEFATDITKVIIEHIKKVSVLIKSIALNIENIFFFKLHSSYYPHIIIRELHRTHKCCSILYNFPKIILFLHE